MEVVLGKQLDVRLPDQTVLRLSPGRDGKGFSAIILTTGTKGASPSKKTTKKPKVNGRPPSPAKELLRKHLQTDRATGNIHDVAHYTRWLVGRADIGFTRARAIVYRELSHLRQTTP